MQLFCFTFAGGTAQFFDVLRPALEPELTLTALEYAGHGTRHREPFCTGIPAVADDLCAKMRRLLRPGEPYALLGYSMGSIVAAVVMQRILNGALPALPRRVFLCAHAPHTRHRELLGFDMSESDGQVIARTLRFGGIPERLIGNRSFWRVYLPIYRADYAMITGYDFAKLDLHTAVPATVMYSGTDTPFAEVKDWDRLFVGPLEFIPYTGSHFFIQQHYREMADVINERLASHEV